MTSNESHPVRYEWRGHFNDEEVSALHAEAFQHPQFDDPWNDLVSRHSLGWVTARDEEGLIGFVNNVWDGQHHAFVEDTIVAMRSRRQGVGAGLIATARSHAAATGCEWLHVDFADHLTRFYYDACGFTPTNAGLIRLK